MGQEQFFAARVEYDMIPQGATVVCALSGGGIPCVF